MTRVLVVSHDSSLYGAQRSLLDAVIGLAARGLQIHVVVPTDGALVTKLREAGVVVTVLEFSRWVPARDHSGKRDFLRYFLTLPRTLVSICKLLRSSGADLVYTNTVTVIDFAIAARLCQRPHVWHLREAAADNPQLRSLFSNGTVSSIVHGLSDTVIFNSHYLARRYGSHHDAKDKVVHNGVSGPAAMSLPLRSEPSGPMRVLTVGYMERRKGLDVLLDALAAMTAADRRRLHVRVAGHIDPEYLREVVQPRMERLAGSVAIELLGWVDNVDTLFEETDLLVSSARDEPFGRTLVEAMLSGLPVLATRSGGPEEIVVDGVTGLLVASDDPRAMAVALADLCSRPHDRHRMGVAGKARAMEYFSVKSYVDTLAEVIAQTFRSTRRTRCD